MSALEPKFESLIDTLVPLAALSASGRTQVLDQAEVLRYRRGDILFKEGDRDAYSIYLLEGRLELRSGGQVVQRLSGGTPAAAHPIAQLQPRKMTARAETQVSVLRLARDLLDRLTAADGASNYCSMQVNELDASDEDDGDWMTRMLQSKLFSRLPASNIHRIFSLFEEIEVRDGQEVVSQGEPGDYYYIIAQGRCEVMRSAGPGAPGYRLALIGPGDAFGEEALVAGSSRNATVRMLCDGQLVRLPKEAFVELIQEPLLSGVNRQQGENILATKPAVWLDVRFPEEHRRDGVQGSVNHPLNTLRMHSGRLDTDLTYVVYCDTGTRSAVAAFLLAERGFDVHYLEGGLMRYDGVPAAAGLDLNAHDGTSGAATAPLPTSQKPARERGTDAAVQAAALSVELAITDIRIADANAAIAGAQQHARDAAAEALRVTTDLARREAELEAGQKIEAERQLIAAEMARGRAEVERRTAEKLRAEKKRIQAAAVAAHRELTEAQRLKAEIEQARFEVQAQAVAAAQGDVIEARRLKDELEQARAAAEAAAAAHAARDQADGERLKAEVERARLDAEAAAAAAVAAAQRETQEAQRLKDELEQVRAAAEAAAASHAARDQVKTARLQAEIERARADAVAAATAAAAATMREAQEARRLNEELERVRAEMEASAAAHAARDQIESERLRAEIERTRAQAEAAVGAAAAAAARESSAAQRLKEELERARLEVEANAAIVAQREARESQRLKEELDQARAQAEAAASAAAAAAEREAAQTQRMREEFECARAEAQAHAAAAAERDHAEAARLKAEIEHARAAAEALAVAAAERERADAERLCVALEQARAEAAQRELAEAERIKAEIERAKAEADAAVQRERDAQRERVDQVRAEMERRLQEEERKLRESYAWQAEELKRLQSQKADAEVRLREEQERLRVQAEESRGRLAEARDYQRRLEEVQEASARETEMREQQQLALERKLREELHHKVKSERRQLEEELARNAIELERARRERDAAEGARHAAAAEAEQIVSEFKDAHARKRMQEEIEMRFERERLEADARRLGLALELAQREKQSALEQQRVIETEIAARQLPAIDSDAANASDLLALQAQAQSLAEQIANNDRAQADAQAAAVTSAGDLAVHRIREERVRADLKREIDEWLRDQDAAEANDSRRGILANQRAHLDRIKLRAQAVRAAAKAHDQTLINELAAKLKRTESE